MDWKEVERQPFTYCGERVQRRKLISKTIFGDFEVFEAVNGRAYLRHPFIESNYFNPLSGVDNGLEEWFGKSKMPCKDIEQGIDVCEKVMGIIKETVNTY